jgi:hypothetical protein
MISYVCTSLSTFDQIARTTSSTTVCSFSAGTMKLTE